MKYFRYVLPSLLFLLPAISYAAPTVNFSVFGGSYDGQQTIEANNISYALSLGNGNGGVTGVTGRRDSQWQFSAINGAYFQIDGANIGTSMSIVHRQDWVGVADNLCYSNVATCHWVATWGRTTRTISIITTGTATRQSSTYSIFGGAYNGTEQTIEAGAIHAGMQLAAGDGGSSTPPDYSNNRDSSYTFTATNGVYFTLDNVNIGLFIDLVHHKDWVGIYGPSTSQTCKKTGNGFNYSYSCNGQTVNLEQISSCASLLSFNYGTVCNVASVIATWGRSTKTLGVNIPDIVTTITPLEPVVPAGSCTNYAIDYSTCTACDTGLTMSGGFCTDLSLVAPPTCTAEPTVSFTATSTSGAACTYNLANILGQTPIGGTSATTLVTSPSGYTGSMPLICNASYGFIPNGTVTCTAPAVSCTATTQSNCSLPATTSGTSADGTCSTNYSGACKYLCTNGMWTSNSNSCTLISVPTVTSPTATSITTTSATLGANVTSNGGAMLTALGTCWGTTTNPTTNCLAQGGTTTGIFTHSRTGLSSGTLIYYRGYATNSTGTGYSVTASFTTTSASCAATTPTNSNCSLPATTSGTSVNGTCSTNYSGSCSYTCANGTWTTPSSNSCTLLPDLTAAGTTATPASGITGTSESFTGSISNIGTGTASNFPNMFQIKNSDLSADIALVAANTVASLAASAATTVSGAYTFASPGTYNIRVCANLNTAWGGSITESNANNNCGSYQPLTVSWSACANGANNPPTCNACSNPLFWNGSSCVACTGGCTGGTCNNGANNPSACNVFKPTAILYVNRASTATIKQGQSATLTWFSTKATSCTAAGGFGVSYNGTAPSNNTGISVSPSTTSNYQISCTGPGGGPVSSNVATVTVINPSASISASPTRVSRGAEPTISWTVTDVGSCAITRNSAPWKPGISSSGSSPDTIPVTSQTVYTISCTDSLGTQVPPASVTVNVLTSFQEF